jgi:Ca2+-binding EF-hand superfamily protein
MSDFWARKIRTYFAKMDTNNDGFISKKDVEDMADSLADAEKSSPEQRKQLKQHFVELWRKYMKSAVGSDDNGLLTPAIMVASIDQQRTDSKFQTIFTKVCHYFFGLRDVNGDGYLSEDEYATSFAGIGVQDTSFVHAAFEYMDLNKDGKIDLAEYSSAMYLYLTTEDEHLLWGPLVD